MILVEADSRDAVRLLSRARELALPELRKAVGRLAEPVRGVAGYHLGWLDAQGRPAASDGGKGVRSALVLASAAALGAEPGQAVRAATAVELVHHFSVLHDDIMDSDVSRRGRPAAWTVFGRSYAILAGDALLALAFEVLTAAPCPAALPETAGEFCAMLAALVAGQAADLAFEELAEVSVEQCTAMAAGKTAALLAGACALGGLAAGGTQDELGALRGYGHHVGLPSNSSTTYSESGATRGSPASRPARICGCARSRCPWWRPCTAARRPAASCRCSIAASGSRPRRTSRR